jgi:hypothetical protein
MASVGRRLLTQRKVLRVTLTATSVSGTQASTTHTTITLRAN